MAENLMASNDVIYDNTENYSNSDTVQGAIDELYDLTSPLAPLYKNIVIVDNTIYYGTEEIGNHPIYFNVTTGEKCNINDYQSNPDNLGNKGCMKFYAYSENANGVNMILDHNTSNQAWVSKVDYENVSKAGDVGITYSGESAPDGSYGTYGNNNRGPLTVLAQLKSDTENWSTELENPETYTPSTGSFEWTIDYSSNGYKARLITAEEVADITKNEGWDISQSYFYFDTKTQNEDSNVNATTPSKYWWLFDNTCLCTTYGCKKADSGTYGYWTSSPLASYSDNAWRVSSDGTLGINSVYRANYYGVRPVITVSKSKIIS